jgi:hypothetical protein
LGLPTGPVALAYGIAMLAFLILEAIWLAGSGPRGTTEDDATTVHDTTTDGDVTTK